MATGRRNLFSPVKIGSLTLKNRLTMAPLYLAYPDPGGRANPLILSHYSEMARSGVAMVITESILVNFDQAGGNRFLRGDSDRHVDDLRRLAAAIKEGGAVAGCQINHPGRFSRSPGSLAPSPVPVAGLPAPREMTPEDIRNTVRDYAGAALRVKQAGFDLVEIHGGTGYLPVQFLSPRTNQRTDLYGGNFENRTRFPLEVVRAVRQAVGTDYPVGYRFLADEWLPGGFSLPEALKWARILQDEGISYLSVTAGTYESFFIPEIMDLSAKEGFMADLAAAVKREVTVPVIAAGRISSPALAENLIAEGKADLVGLARVLLADPLWPSKAMTGRDGEINHCLPGCAACMQMVMQETPVVCAAWPDERKKAAKKAVSETGN